MKKEIPVFFSSDDNYLPFLDVAIGSLIENASRECKYRIIILNTGISSDGMATVMARECDGFRIEFTDITDRLSGIKSRLKDVYHFSLVTYYRLFIGSLFPEYDKIVYLDCDLVVLGDVSRLYNTDIGDSIIAAAPEAFVRSTPEFREYASEALGVNPDEYVNAGVLLMNLEAFRENRIEEKFINLISEYDFDLIDPDQAYLNYLCRGKIYELNNGWNKEPINTPCEGEKCIVHYALYKKPWQYDDVIDGEYFWFYATRSPFYERICQIHDSFDDECRAKKDAAARRIIEEAGEIVASENNFKKRLCSVVA